MWYIGAVDNQKKYPPFPSFSYWVDGIIYKRDLPCWSVGRLIEIMKICSKSRYALRGLFLFLEECKADECMSQVMDYFEICNYQFDFSKLEE